MLHKKQNPYFTYIRNKVKTRAFMTSNGTEPQWKYYKVHYDTTGRQGSNCYSFAMNDFRPQGSRSNKSVPGDISNFVATRVEPYTKDIQKFQRDLRKKPFRETNWRSCKEPVYRLLMDGRATAIIHGLMGVNLKYKTTIKMVKPNISRALNTVVQPGWRKVLMVVDSLGGDGMSTTDFHFFSQHRLPLSELYNVKLETMLKNGGNLDNERGNVYIAADINAFTSTRDIVQRYVPNLPRDVLHRVHKELLKPSARALTNLRLHLKRMPTYAVLFVPRPFWLLDVNRATVDAKKKLKASKQRLETIMRGEDNMVGLKVVQTAYSQCVDILNKKKGRELRLDYTLGTFSEKAGWASQAMNADGSGKMILDPHLCDRNHGGYDYDKSCVVVKVLDGYGMTSVPSELKNMI